jgi:hypothetical protein
MHPLLISQIAQDEIAERLRAVERERLARQASRSASLGAPTPGARSRLQRLVGGRLAQRPAWRSALPAMDRTRPDACPEGDRS